MKSNQIFIFDKRIGDYKIVIENINIYITFISVFYIIDLLYNFVYGN